ncbi:MAG: SOS response-associated peptidase [Clostridiales bacterium]|jgi:putative SOS response-associated peptidase YedK|nr:SOS response-associated peptidase [Clostridiales bacterium]
MCGRYQTPIGDNELDFLISIAQTGSFTPFQPGTDAFPSNLLPVLIPSNVEITGLKMLRKCAVGFYRWGYPAPSGSGLIINARAETAHEKPIFSASLRRARCVIPAYGFYEWTNTEPKQKYYFMSVNTPKGIKETIFLAGLYNIFDIERRFVILTTEANDSVADIHDRMPVILDRSEVEPWLTDLDYSTLVLRRVPPLLSRNLVG